MYVQVVKHPSRHPGTTIANLFCGWQFVSTVRLSFIEFDLNIGSLLRKKKRKEKKRECDKHWVWMDLIKLTDYYKKQSEYRFDILE